MLLYILVKSVKFKVGLILCSLGIKLHIKCFSKDLIKFNFKLNLEDFYFYAVKINLVEFKLNIFIEDLIIEGDFIA